LVDSKQSSWTKVQKVVHGNVYVANLVGPWCPLAWLALGIIGLIVGFTDSIRKLGTVGWFAGGMLLGVVAVILLLDEYVSLRRNN